ncbi:MAG: hypothetical protein ACJAUV_001151 [Flavobacteriales bacterium]|jgi:hypothetical protein
MKLSILLVCTSVLFIQSHTIAQSCGHLLALKKGSELVIKDNMKTQDKNGFYVYRNCIYNLSLQDGTKNTWQVVDFNETHLTVKKPFTNAIDTNIAFGDLQRLFLISEKNIDWYSDIDLRNYSLTYETGNTDCMLPSIRKSIYKKDTTTFELIPYLTFGGIKYLYQENDEIFLYESDLKKRKKRTKKVNNSYTKRYGIWFTPNKVEEIKGVAIGLNANNYKNYRHNLKDSLLIKGMNIEFNPHAVLKLANSGGFGPFADDLNYYGKNLAHNTELIVKGFNVSLIGTNQRAILKGANIGLISTVVHEQYGFTLSGLNNFSYVFKGVAIAGVVNRTTKGKGLQIAAFNRCEEFIGVQIGFWNVIGNKSRPFVNWNFKKKKGK